jgi:AraC-like DNA-binding protein
MFNFLDKIRETPSFYRQLSVDRQLVTEFNCPLETNKETMWSDQGYFVYVLEGTKIWHTPARTIELKQGQCLFVKKGAHIIEQVFDTRFCLVVFFVSDQFIIDTIGAFLPPVAAPLETQDIPVLTEVHTDNSLHAFFNSIVTYFMDGQEVNKTLLELKFRELILNVAANPLNKELITYFQSLLSHNQTDTMNRVMEENFRFNLRIEDYARLCGRSLSAFKRDFENSFQSTPGRWLLARRLQHARILLRTSGSSISEVAYDSGFENTSHFSRAFKQYYGYPPTSERDQHAERLSIEIER